MKQLTLLLLMAVSLLAAAQTSANDKAFEEAMGYLTDDSTRDELKAFDIMKRLCAKGHEKAMYEMASVLITGSEKIKPDTLQGVEIARKLAQKGNAPGQRLYAQLLREGTGMERNPVLSLSYDLKAAEQGDIIGMNNYAVALMAGDDGIAPDTITAIGWLRKAAEKDYPFSQWVLASYYRNKGNSEEARYWLRRGYTTGSPECIHGLGLSHLNGENGLEKNEAKALEYFELAANDLGFEESMIEAGTIYGNRKNLKKQREYYLMAADRGNLYAWIRYAETYLGIDNKKAFDTFMEMWNTPGNRIRSDQFYLISYIAYRIGLHRYLGLGCERDTSEGAQLIYDAAEDGLPFAIDAIRLHNIPRP